MVMAENKATRASYGEALKELGAELTNWVRLQEDHECYYSIVDWHALM